MRRILPVKIIASLIIAQGLWDIGEVIYALFFSYPHITIKVFPFIGGILEFFAGISLFKLEEAGRKMILILSSISVIVGVLFISWMLFFWKDGSSGSAIYFLDDPIFETESRLLSAGIHFAFLVIPLFIIMFLSQKGTKMLFIHEETNNLDADTTIESV